MTLEKKRNNTSHKRGRYVEEEILKRYWAKGEKMKSFMKWSYFWVLIVGILIGYIGIPMLSRLVDLIFN